MWYNGMLLLYDGGSQGDGSQGDRRLTIHSRSYSVSIGKNQQALEEIASSSACFIYMQIAKSMFWQLRKRNEPAFDFFQIICNSDTKKCENIAKIRRLLTLFYRNCLYLQTKLNKIT